MGAGSTYILRTHLICACKWVRSKDVASTGSSDQLCQQTSNFLLGLLDIPCEDEAHGVVRHTANNVDTSLPEDRIASQELVSHPLGLDGLWQGITINGCEALLDRRLQGTDRWGLSLDGQDGQQSICIIGPAGIAFGQIDRWGAAAALLQLLFSWSRQHEIEIGDPAQGGKIQTT